MPRTLSSLLSLLILVLAFALPASAQVSTGTPPFGSFGGGPDVINLANLNSHITVPITQRSGRGTNFSFNLGYDSSVWIPVGSSGHQVWDPIANWGWTTQTQVLTGAMTVVLEISEPCYTTILGHTRQTGYYAEYTDWVYIDPRGGTHTFNSTTIAGYGTCNGQNVVPVNANETASDGSGYTFVTTQAVQNGVYYDIGQIKTNNGSISTPPINLDGTNGNFSDRNGNLMNVDSSGHFYDTLSSTTPVLTIAGSGTPTVPVTYTYSAPGSTGNGTAVAYTAKYTTYSVQTNFGCSGITDYGTNGTSTANLVSEIDLPDGSKYSFAYEPTPSHSGFVTGRLASVTLPTGGTISYTYSGGSSGHITCADGSAATVTRTTPDGSWTYAHSESGTAWTSLITDPQGNQTNINFQGIYETLRQVYQGTTSGTLLQTINTCYNGAASPCTATFVTLPITRRTQLVALPSNTGKVCEHDQYFNVYGLQTEQDDYDYGSGAPASISFRKAIIVYDTALTNNIVGMPSSVTTCNGTGTSSSCTGPSGSSTGTVAAQTTYAYDQTTPTTSNPASPQWTSVSGSRGNATTIQNLVSGSTYLTQTSSYYDSGNINVATDVNAGQTIYSYTTGASCGNAFPTGITEAISTLTQSYTWNCTGGVQLTVTDENSQTTTTAYSDADFWRPASVTDPLGYQTAYYYQPNPGSPLPFAIVSYLTFNSGNSVASDYKYLDALGRIFVDQRIQSPTASLLDSVSYTFDTNGRPYSTSVPCAIAWNATCSTPKTTQTYDALSRPLVTTDGGGGTTTYAYNQNDVLVTVGPAPSGENTKRRQLEYDALGRLTSVCEVTTLTGSGTCGQTTTQTGYWTKYTYDALGDLLTVTQNAQAATGSQQTRNYTYDALSRLTSETNAENGTTSYTFDSDATCGTSDGDLVKHVNAAGVATCTHYDVLHRPTSISYSSGGDCKFFAYDSNPGLGFTEANLKGRLSGAWLGNCSTGSATTSDLGFNYSARGELVNTYQWSANSGVWYNSTASYWPNGALQTLQLSTCCANPTSLIPTITYNVDGEGRPLQVTASSGQNPVTSIAFNSASSPTAVSFGSGDSDTFTYDPNTFRLNKYQFKVGSQTVTGTVGWNPNGSLGSLNISDPFSTANTQNCSFAADDLARISQVNCGTIWGQNFTYDPFGNITKNKIAGTGATSFTPTYQSSPSITNRVSSVGGVSATYDANGNSLNDTFRTFTWDADSNPITIGSVSLTYDAFDRMVEQSVSGSNSQIVYSPAGAKLALMKGATLTKAFIPLIGGDTAVYTSSGLAYYRHADDLGSSRFASTPSQTLYSDTAYSPFGEPYASSGAIDNSFTGQNQDTAAGLYDFLYREYDPNQSRWTSPDPAGLASVDPTNPQSWNRYVYALNNPLASVDALGLQCVWDDGSFDSSDDAATGSYGGCTDAGGTYFDPSTFQAPNGADWSASPDAGLAEYIANSLNDMPDTMVAVSSGPLAGGSTSYSWSFITSFLTFAGGPGNVPTCAGQTLKYIGGEMLDLTELAKSQTAEAALTGASVTQNARAWAYAANQVNTYGGRGLICPSCSSVFRSMASKAEVLGEASEALPVLHAGYYAGKSIGPVSAEARNGACAAAFPVL
jgi:RHS repeat-associated protein